METPKEGDITQVLSGPLAGLNAYVHSVADGHALVKAHGFLAALLPLGDLEILPPAPKPTYEHVMNEIDLILAEAPTGSLMRKRGRHRVR